MERASIFSMTAFVAVLANFFAGERKFSRLLLDNARAPALKKFLARRKISTEAVDNFWITQA